MQQNTKGLLLFVFLISVSVFGINFFNNNDSEESVEVTQTTLFEATTTTSTVIKTNKFIKSSKKLGIVLTYLNLHQKMKT